MSDLKILGNLAQLYALGMTTPTRAFVATMAGYTPKSLSTLSGPLKRKNYIEYPTAKTMAITELGLERVSKAGGCSAADKLLPMTYEGMMEFVKKTFKLGSAHMKILQALLLQHDVPHSKAALANKLGIQKNSFGTYTAFLKGLELVEYPSKDFIQLTDMTRAMFPQKAPGDVFSV